MYFTNLKLSETKHLINTLLAVFLVTNFSITAQSNTETTIAKGDPAFEIVKLLEVKKLQVDAEIDSMVKRNPTIFLGLKDSIELYTDKIRLNNKNFVGEDLSYLDLSGLDLGEADFRYASLVNTDLTGTNLARANFSGAILEGVILDSANVTEANFAFTLGTNISAKNVDFINAKLQTAYWPHSYFENSNFINSSVNLMNFNGSYFKRTLFQSSELANNSFWGAVFEECIWDDTRTCENNFKATTIFNSGWKDSKFSNNNFENYFMLDNVASNTLMQNNKYSSFKPFVYGFIRSKNGILSNSFKSGGLEITNFNLNQFMQFYASQYETIKIKSYYYWNIYSELTKLNAYFIELNKARLRKPLRYDSFTSVYISNNGNIEVYDKPIAIVAWEKFYSDLRKHFLTEDLKRENDLKIPDFSSSDETSETNRVPRNAPIPNITSDIPVLGSFEWANVAYLSFSRRFDPNVFSGIDDVRELLDTKNYIDAIEKISKNQDVILKAAHDASLDLNPTSFFRARSTNNAKLNHVIGSVDFSLRGINRIDNPEEKRELSKQLSEQLGDEHLVILEELIWVQEGKSIHSASNAIRAQSRNRFREIVPKYKPPLTIEHHKGELPNQLDVVQLNTYYINGVRVGANWGKAWASAQHIHVQIKEPEVYLPSWAKKLLNERWKFYSRDINSNMDDILKHKIQPYYPKELLTTMEDSPEISTKKINIDTFLKLLREFKSKIIIWTSAIVVILLFFSFRKKLF